MTPAAPTHSLAKRSPNENAGARGVRRVSREIGAGAGGCCAPAMADGHERRARRGLEGAARRDAATRSYVPRRALRRFPAEVAL
jgi:hypothetical protein